MICYIYNLLFTDGKHKFLYFIQLLTLSLSLHSSVFCLWCWALVLVVVGLNWLVAFSFNSCYWGLFEFWLLGVLGFVCGGGGAQWWWWVWFEEFWFLLSVIFGLSFGFELEVLVVGGVIGLLGNGMLFLG